MPKTTAIKKAQGVERRLASVSVALEGADPTALLGLGLDGPRGFWAREGRWFAHTGEAGRITVQASETGPTRFRETWAHARKLLSCSWKDPDSLVTPPAPRLFGGFSFRDDHRAEGYWEAFPPALFILPEIELMGGESGAVLTLRRFVSPFDTPDQFRTELNERLEFVAQALTASPAQSGDAEPWIPATRFDTHRDAWHDAVVRALSEIEDGSLSKVVLARGQSLLTDGILDAVDVVRNLRLGNPGSHVFLFEPSPGNVLLGAAPETVATVSGGGFRATAVAGSTPRGRTEEERGALAAELLQSRKDRHEHRMCVEDMIRRLAGISQEVRAAEEPHVLTLSSIQHLETAIEARLRPDVPVLEALEALHPTPAVCGLPRDRALAFLREEEPFERGWYAGPVGWFDGDGNGVFVPALRSTVGMGREWRLFAGAGIVSGSDPEKEWEETRIKFHPVLRALAGARVRRSPQEGPGDGVER